MDRIFTVSAERNGAALTEMRAAPLGCLVGAAVGGTTSAGAGRMTSEASLLGVGNSAGDQLTGNTVGHLRQRRSSGGFSGWCGWWCRRRRRVPADAVGDSSKGSPDCRGNVGELRSDRCCDIVSIGPFCSVIRIVRTNAGTYRTRDVVSTPLHAWPGLLLRPRGPKPSGDRFQRRDQVVELERLEHVVRSFRESIGQ
jgi:hypothetical protein